jgi:NAD/FAD-utilizing enzyme apparently involved in cell division
MYLNGLSTSLPFDTQIKMVKSVPGLENASILRPGYGIEYDFFPPQQLKPTLESKTIKNLFFAGQINGTSGYEEAGCQGIIAGINAAESVRQGNFLILGRETSYTGILIDDLVTKGTEEPYRMFTSRAEHRLELRQDNCDERLMPVAYSLGLIDKGFFEKRQRVWEEKKKYKEDLQAVKISPEKWNIRNNHNPIKKKTQLFELLKRPEVTIDDVEDFLDDISSKREVKKGVEADIKYSGFVQKEKIENARYQKMEDSIIPDNVNYEKIKGLLNDTKVKFSTLKPRSLGQALRIPGVTPADISVLMVYLSKLKHVSRGTVDL